MDKEILGKANFAIVEAKRFLKRKRNYVVTDATTNEVLLRLEENINPFRLFGRLMPGMAPMSLIEIAIENNDGQELYKIKKGFGPIAAFKLMKDNGLELVAKVADKIRFNDDSFLEVYDSTGKNVIYKSGLSDASYWFPVSIYKSEDAKSENFGMAISGKVFASVIKEKSGRIIDGTSGDSYTLAFSEPVNNIETFMQMLTFVVAVDYKYDTKN